MGQENQPKKKSETRFVLHLLRRNPLVLIGSFLALGSVVLGLLSPLIVNPNAWDFRDFDIAKCWNNPIINWHIANIFTCPGNHVYSLGTDAYGRDLWQMIVLSIPLDLQIAFEIVSVAFIVGVALGSLAAYAGGIIDELVLRITDIFFAFPLLSFAIVLVTVRGAHTLGWLTLAVMVIWWPTYVRLARSRDPQREGETLRRGAQSHGGWKTQDNIPTPPAELVLPDARTGDARHRWRNPDLLRVDVPRVRASPQLAELGNLVNDGISKAQHPDRSLDRALPRHCDSYHRARDSTYSATVLETYWTRGCEDSGLVTHWQPILRHRSTIQRST